MNDLLRATSSHVVLQKSLISTVCSIILGIILSLLGGCGTGGEGGPAISTSSPPTEATASMVWDPVQDPTMTPHDVDYGEQSSGQSGSCSDRENASATGSNATSTGFDPDPRDFSDSAQLADCMAPARME